MCDPSATMGPTHTCKGTRASSCQAHWPSYDFDKDQSWCCDSWCYVSNVTCTPELQEKYGITLGESWTETGLWYSYGACPDAWSAPKGMEAVSFSTYDKDTCPYTKETSTSVSVSARPNPTLPGCECTGDNRLLGVEEKAVHGADYGKWCSV